MMAILPYVLSLLSLVNIGLIWNARRTSLRRDVRAHRKFMAMSLALWGSTLLLFAIYLGVRGVRVLAAVPEVIFSLYLVLAVLTVAGLIVTFYRAVKQCRAPYNDFAPKALLVWGLCCLLGVVFFPLTDAHIYPISNSF